MLKVSPESRNLAEFIKLQSALKISVHLTAVYYTISRPSTKLQINVDGRPVMTNPQAEDGSEKED